MDALRGKVNQTPEEREKRQKQLVLPNILQLSLSIAMLVVGLQYNDEKYCKNQAPLYLVIGGGIMVGMTALKLFAFLTPCEFDDKLADCLTPFANLGEFVILIWGSVVVFGAYATWTYDNIEDPHYCEYTPFKFAFVLLILKWVLAPIILCLECFLCCGLFYVLLSTANKDGPTPRV